MNKEKLTEYYFDFIDTKFKNDKEINNIAISGKWGSGKTTILESLKNKLEENNYEVIIINLWKYELIENNLFPIILLDLVYQVEKDQKKKESILQKIKLTFSLNVSFSPIFNMNISFRKKRKSQEFIHFDYYQSLKEMLNELNNFINSVEKNIVVIFDELDRCSTKNIIDILTGIKNIFFNLKSKKIFFISGINQNQIDNLLDVTQESYVEKIFAKIFYLEEETEYWAEEKNQDIYIKFFLDLMDEKQYRLVKKIKSQKFFPFFLIYVREKKIKIRNLEEIKKIFIDTVSSARNKVNKFKEATYQYDQFQIETKTIIKSIKEIGEELNKENYIQKIRNLMASYWIPINYSKTDSKIYLPFLFLIAFQEFSVEEIKNAVFHLPLRYDFLVSNNSNIVDFVKIRWDDKLIESFINTLSKKFIDLCESNNFIRNSLQVKEYEELLDFSINFFVSFFWKN